MTLFKCRCQVKLNSQSINQSIKLFIVSNSFNLIDRIWPIIHKITYLVLLRSPHISILLLLINLFPKDNLCILIIIKHHNILLLHHLWQSNFSISSSSLHLGCWCLLWSLISCSKGDISLCPIPNVVEFQILCNGL